MLPSLFNVPVPLTGGADVFVLNTFTDAQAVVSREVLAALEGLARGDIGFDRLPADQQEAIRTLQAEGLVVASHDTERAAVREYFTSLSEDTSQLRVTVLTTLQCNFACGYCVQGDHGTHAGAGNRMSLDTAARTVAWIEERLESLRPRSLVLTFFGGEPLLNLPAVYLLAEQAAEICRARECAFGINVITNGLLLTPDVVDRLLPLGLSGIKVTLDGTRELHDRRRPLRGGQGTFDQIVDNVRRVAGRCRVAIGGNFEADETDHFRELLDFLAAQEFAPLLDQVNFKPVIRPRPSARGGVIPLTLVTSTAGGRVADAAPIVRTQSSPCDTCHFVDEQMATLREETKARGFRTIDGVHMGPCEIHRQHAYTIGPDGALYACPGFAGEAAFVTGHVDEMPTPNASAAPGVVAGLTPWRDACGDCAFVPVCGGGCSVAAHAEQGDPRAPSCHKPSFEAAVRALAHEVTAA